MAAPVAACGAACSFNPVPRARGRRWDRDCVSKYSLAAGSYNLAWRELVTDRLPDQAARDESLRCPCGAPVLELDHRLSIGVAQEMAQALISTDADPNSRDEVGRTPLNRAARHGHSEVEEVLITACADPDLRDDSTVLPEAS